MKKKEKDSVEIFGIKSYYLTLGLILLAVSVSLTFSLINFFISSGEFSSLEFPFFRKGITGLVTVDIDSDGLKYGNSDITPLTPDKFVLAYTSNKGAYPGHRHLFFDIYYTNGTQFGSTVDFGDIGDWTKSVSVQAFNETHFVVSWVSVWGGNPLNGDFLFSIYDTDFNLISDQTLVYDGLYTATDVAVLNSTHFVAGYSRSSYGGRTYYKMFDCEGNLIVDETIIEYTINAGSDSDQVFTSVSAFNSSHFVECFFDNYHTRGNNTVKCEIWSVEGVQLGSTFYVTNNAHNDSRALDVAVINSTHWVVSWYNLYNDDYDLRDNALVVYDINGVEVARFDSDDNVPKTWETESRVVPLNSTHIVTSWTQSVEQNATFRVYDTEGNPNTGIINASINIHQGSGHNSGSAPVASEVFATGLGICNDNFIMAWNETSNGDGLIWRAYYPDGTEWDGVCCYDTCTYPGSGNWDINCSDYCNITDNVAGDGSDINIIGDGHTVISANITGFDDIHVDGLSGYCTVTCRKGGCIK